uniref:Uncharacterized protein n=1 Tax=Panagrolaimus davidi TaxID=227884 RepID=A0A914PP83_9BILA
MQIFGGVGSSIGKTVVYDHECSKNLVPTVGIAKKVQPFLIPNLPMFDDEKFTTNDVIEALTRVFPFIEHEKVIGFDQAWNDFEIFLKNPPFFKFEIKDKKLQPIGNFENANLWPSVEITAENREKLELFVYLRYVLLVIKYKKQTYSWEENEKLAQLAKECLVLSGPASRNLLPLKVIHSLWAICAYTHTMYFCYLEDDELAKEANSYFYMFKMAFLQYPEAFQLHIDIAIAYYQINSRIKRHKESVSV